MEENKHQITTLHNLLDYDATKFTSAEIQLRNVLPMWINETNSLKLRSVLQKYLEFTKAHVESMESFFKEEEIISLSLDNRVMKAFIKETTEKLSYCTDMEIKDACLLAGVQAINHFKISTYGTAAAFATALDMKEHATAFKNAEINEKEIDDRLSLLANSEINIKAKSPVVLPASN